MNPTERLIVALDLPSFEALVLVTRLRLLLGIKNFKLGVSSLLDPHGVDLIRKIMEGIAVDGAGGLMLDLKVWDTPDSVRRIVEQALSCGARWVTVRAEPEVVWTALAVAREYPGAVILPVGNLTSDPVSANMVSEYLMTTKGAVVPGSDLRRLRARFPAALLATPGARLPGHEMHDHNPRYGVITPGEAVKLGADHVIVGRPITGATDPVVAARAYLKDLELAA